MNNTENYQVGDKIYYTGDMANNPAFGVIIKRRESDRFAPISYDIEFDNGQIDMGIYHLSFKTGGGRRFWLLSEWEADRKIKIEEMQKHMREILNKREAIN